MATVRIYKVAELLGTTSQEVLALLKRDHGIELKSASSTIEEVVARSFVERLARQRSISLPGGDMFAEHAVPAKITTAKKAPAPKKAEPAKPVAPVLGPPRLVKTVKPYAPAETAAPAAEAPPPPDVEHEPVEVPVEVAATPPPVVEVEPPPPVVIDEAPPVVIVPDPPQIEEPPVVEETVEEPPTPIAAAASVAPASAPSGRFVPPTIRLRIEEPGRTPQPARPLAPAKRPQVTQPRIVHPPAPPAAGAKPATPATGRAPAPARPGGAGQAPRAPYSPGRPTTPGMLGGPRPLPSQPVRTQPPAFARPGGPPAPAGQQPRPPFGQRPPGGGYRPPVRSTGTRRERPSSPSMPSAPSAPPPITRIITLAEGMTVKDLADKLDVRVKDVLAKLLMRRMMMTINSTMDVDTAKDLAREFGAEIEMRSFEQELVSAEGDESKPEDIKPRAPVVTVMGHVDHGKTSLLDAIRETKVAEREAGGITQHIGAYHVDVGDGRSVVFLDTPGHEAFTLMRARGAKVTDVVVLVVAADDGVMPQTREAIDHAKAANVPIVVAINKIDKPGANPDNVKRELAELNLVPEDWGGTTVMVPVSAKKRQNLDQLLEMILLSTDILELRANPKRSASGAVLEAKLDRGRGPVATVLVQRGTLKVGDIIVAGAEMGRVRALISDQGENLDEAGPSVPVEVLGFNGPPEAGDRLAVVENEARARQVTSYRAHQKRENAAASISGMRGSLEQMMSQLKTAGRKEFPLIVKADVQGSLEAILGSLEKLGTEEVAARILHAGVGGISESDVTLAEGFNAAIIGFSVRANKEAAAAAKRNGIEIRYYNIIYDLVDDIKKAMSGLLAPTLRETMLGNAQILEVFNISKVGKVA
ncbi:MAG TPA: translation initiation factor IF-2, partial [Vicinamibacterales bacterium]|nr:translation initiation factor IF-2 [Vicinamibacterales bacterium]